ncbi:hypothetical protein OIDMADRAFT_23294 [Oidiodendron maius Zn]|uniref:Leucine carboxyl methyltransferase 1 n=1 Tax=Oidiodendron maius (strain Zn) TaxID=913774 RepID=A0A0C3DAY1_OIDMZ|nr:hypothetical protein OIDMADRAFT_23294 [Oidiodendron maius Zn]
MSSSHIPNLLTSRRGPRLRGRGGGRGQGRGHDHVGASASSRRDQTIQATDTDAAVSRLSAVALGYLDDPYAQYFVHGAGTRRLPIINRGTYARTTAIDALVEAFLSLPESSSRKKQIISLGAGTDTRYFRLRAQNRHHNLIYHEFDYPSVCAAKYRIVEADIPALDGESLVLESGEAVLGNGEPQWSLLSSVNVEPDLRYICHPLDLRRLPSLESTTSIRGLQTDIPTLIISECCLCYLDVTDATAVIKWFVEKIAEVGIVLYEPVGPDDAFGQMMTDNLAARGITMPTVQRYKSITLQKERLAELGFREEEGGGGNDAVSVEHIWQTWVTDEERARVDSLEGLDEIEEWQMLARHYAVSWGWTGRWDDWMKPLVRIK